MNNMSLMTLLVTSPTQFFVELKKKTNFWFPSLVLIVTTLLVTVWYFQIVDINWLIDKTIASNPAITKLPEAQRAQVMAQMSKFMSRGVMTLSSVVSIVLMLPIAMLVSALYLSLAGKVTKVSATFANWFSMCAWASLPTVINSVAGVIILAMQTAPAQINQGDTQVLSLNELIFHREMGEPGYTLLVSITLPLFLSLALTVIGVKTWSQRSWLFSAVFALLPTALIFGIWALVSLA